MFHAGDSERRARHHVHHARRAYGGAQVGRGRDRARPGHPRFRCRASLRQHHARMPFPIVVDVAAYLATPTPAAATGADLTHIIPGHDPAGAGAFPAARATTSSASTCRPRQPIEECMTTLRLHRPRPHGRRHGGAAARPPAATDRPRRLGARSQRWSRKARKPPVRREGSARRADIVFASLPSPQIVDDTLLGPEGRRGRPREDHRRSFHLRSRARRSSSPRRLRSQGIATFDAPVSGGVKPAHARHAVADGVGPRGRYGTIRPLLERVRQALLHGRDAGRRADDEAGQQPARCGRDRRHGRGDGDGHQGWP